MRPEINSLKDDLSLIIGKLARESFTIEVEDVGEFINYNVEPHNIDRGILIGKKGQMIHSLRMIANCLGAKYRIKPNVKIL